MEFYANSIVYNNDTAIIGSLIDITERILEENRINVAILETQEKERMQIGMELHDNVKQILSGISIYLDVVQKKIDDKEVVLGILNKLKKYNNDAVTELRRLSHQLAPLVEDDTSLKDKIDWLIQSLKLHDSFSIHVNVDEINFKFNNNIQLHFYRILQELLGNIVKYSKANKVEISISKTNDSVLFVVKDNGIGFDVSQKKQGIGLENIRRRVKILNGELKVNSEIGKGVEVLIKVPLV
jgi:signal transduction histidine kinase